MTKQLTTIILIAFIGGALYYSYGEAKRVFFPPKPCTEPITYSIGAFDERFDISQAEFLKAARDAEKAWEGVLGKELFSYSATGTMKINLIYDYRQLATEKQSDISVDISQDKEGYEKMKASYQALLAEYKSKKTAYERESASFEKDKAAYQERVAYWNERGGAPKGEYEKLENEGNALNDRAGALNKKGDTLDSLADKVNTAAAALNGLAEKLNMKVDKFNTIGASTGEEFNEGEYILDRDGVRINVYQFDTVAKLRRLLEHELGHALGLEHVDDPQAIMYRLNSSKNEKPTEADIAELNAVCNAK